MTLIQKKRTLEWMFTILFIISILIPNFITLIAAWTLAAVDSSLN